MIVAHLHSESSGLVVGRELISVPSKKRVASVSVDAAQHAVCRGESQLVLESMASEGAKM